MRLDGERIRRRRNFLWLTQTELSRTVGISRGAIRHLEKARMPGLNDENAAKLAAALGVDLADIQPKIEESNQQKEKE